MHLTTAQSIGQADNEVIRKCVDCFKIGTSQGQVHLMICKLEWYKQR
jgi:hypothetical protein